MHGTGKVKLLKLFSSSYQMVFVDSYVYVSDAICVEAPVHQKFAFRTKLTIPAIFGALISENSAK